LLFVETLKSKIHSPAVGAIAQPNSIIALACAFATAASAAEWFFIAVLSAAMKKKKFFSALSACPAIAPMERRRMPLANLPEADKAGG